MKAIYRVLLALGSVLILFALFMDTTVETGHGRVHNTGLQSDRQLLLILGCLLVLIGVILFAVKKLKQTPSQETAEVEARQAAVESVKDSADHAIGTVKGLGTGLLSKFRKAKGDRFDARLLVASFVALCTLPVSDGLLVWWLLPLIVFLYSLNGRPSFDVMRSLLLFNVYWTLLNAGVAGVVVFQMSPDLPVDGFSRFAVVALPLTCTAISLAALAYIGRRRSQMGSSAKETNL